MAALTVVESDAPAGPEPVHALIDFEAIDADGACARHAFGAPIEVLSTDDPAEVRAVLDAVEARSRLGRWCVGYVRYEAAAAFDKAFVTHSAEGPLVWFGVHERPLGWPVDSDDPYDAMHWADPLDRVGFDRRIARIHEAIGDGEVYQINLTSRAMSPFSGSGRGLFSALRRAQSQGYGAYLKAGDEEILSVSPELFFDWRYGLIRCRPMKGTAPRGTTPEDDAARSAHLKTSAKERAENLMIVDLIRNDLSRLALPHSVTVPALFETRAWPTVWQMTSDVQARTRAGTSLADVFAALFPCGSITGAPKVRAMYWIRQLEDEPRGVYCGAVGVVQPGGAATFSVAIRTVSVQGDRATCGIGSGITADARAEGEWAEWRHKRAFLERAAAHFELLETSRLQDGRMELMHAHVQRMVGAALHFAWINSAQAKSFARLIGDEFDRLASEHPGGLWRVRLTADREGRVSGRAFAMADTPEPVRVALADRPFLHARSEFSRFKTTRREHYDAFTPTGPGVFDTLLWNEEGEVTEFTRGNVALRLDGVWTTPPLSCGLLGGTGRAQALAQGRLVERVVRKDELQAVDAIAFVNGLRGWLTAEWVD
ncbi:MAG: bifunctional aminodeoxychorismate synthase component I/aminotransferase [Rhizobacter sp.]|nr:bifunctional aminodeoxychorismate synthase component I/aminotransferase [Rhizobacter sp.]